MKVCLAIPEWHIWSLKNLNFKQTHKLVFIMKEKKQLKSLFTPQPVANEGPGGGGWVGWGGGGGGLEDFQG